MTIGTARLRRREAELRRGELCAPLEWVPVRARRNKGSDYVRSDEWTGYPGGADGRDSLGRAPVGRPKAMPPLSGECV